MLPHKCLINEEGFHVLIINGNRFVPTGKQNQENIYYLTIYYDALVQCTVSLFLS